MTPEQIEKKFKELEKKICCQMAGIVNGVGSNFANTDLTFTDNRDHNLDGYTLTLTGGDVTITEDLTLTTGDFTVNSGDITFGSLANNGNGIVAVNDDGELSFAPTPINVYEDDSSLTGNRIVDLAGSSFTIIEGVNSFIEISPALNNEYLTLQAFNNTGSGNGSSIQLSTTDTVANMQIGTGFNGSVNTSYISILSGAIDSAVIIGATRIALQDGIPVHADNAAALTALLQVGDLYRTGDLLKIVHL